MTTNTPQTTTGTLAEPTGRVERAGWFGLLADPLRLTIVELLAGEQLCTCHLVERTGAKQTTVSHHLRLLREAGAVTTAEEGRFTWYRLSPLLPRTLAEHLAELAAAAESSGPGPVACP